LLDDSHAKAALQPHNHLCIPEYTRAQRNADLAALKLAQQQQHSTSRQEDSAADADADASTHAPDDTMHKRKKRKRAQAQQEATIVSDGGAPAAAFDETLLAVIGILHAARLESSVAGWLRADALFLLLDKRGGGDGDGDGAAKAWCDDPVLVRAWASRGREAMHELHLEVEHGVEP
jgi:hypothetical protein